MKEKLQNLLNEYRTIDEKMTKLLEKYQEEHDKIALIRSSSNNDGMPHAKRIIKKTEDDAIKLALIFQSLKEEADVYGQKKKEIVDIIMQADEPVKVDILWQRYIEGKTMSEISMNIGLSERQTYRIHDKTIKELQERQVEHGTD